jgi:hypothetical protein
MANFVRGDEWRRCLIGRFPLFFAPLHNLDDWLGILPTRAGPIGS